MTQTTTIEMTVGIDLGDRFSHFCVLDGAGEVIEEGRVKTTRQAMGLRFDSGTPVRIAIEAGTHSPWVSSLLKDAGHEVLVANPRKLRMNFQNDSKNDRFDAAQLARVARLDPRLLCPIEHRRRQAQVDLALLRARDGLVKVRTRLVNHVRSTAKVFGERVSGRGASTFARRAARQIPKELRPALVPPRRTIAELTSRIRRYERRIERLCRDQYPETAILRQVSGVGAVTALSFVLILDDPLRFSSGRAVGAFLGLRPKQSQAGKHDPQLRITKAGNRELRRLLVQSAQYTLGPFGQDSDLRRFGEAIASRGGKVAKHRAVIAVAPQALGAVAPTLGHRRDLRATSELRARREQGPRAGLRSKSHRSGQGRERTESKEVSKDRPTPAHPRVAPHRSKDIEPPSPGNCDWITGPDRPQGSSTKRPRIRMQRPNWTDLIMYRAQEVGSSRVSMEAWQKMSSSCEREHALHP